MSLVIAGALFGAGVTMLVAFVVGSVLNERRRNRDWESVLRHRERMEADRRWRESQ